MLRYVVLFVRLYPRGLEVYGIYEGYYGLYHSKIQQLTRYSVSDIISQGNLHSLAQLVSLSLKILPYVKNEIGNFTFTWY